MRVRVLRRLDLGSSTDGNVSGGGFSGEVVGIEPEVGTLRAGELVAGMGSGGIIISVPAGRVVRAPEPLTPAEAAVLPVLAVALRAARLARPRPGQIARVVGSGVLAELIALALRVAGVPDVIASTSGPAAGDGHSVAIDTTGDPVVIVSLLETAPRFGRVVLVGSTWGRTASVDFYRTIHQRGLEVTGVSEFGPFAEPGRAVEHEIERAANIIRSGAPELAQAVAATRPAEDGAPG